MLGILYIFMELVIELSMLLKVVTLIVSYWSIAGFV